MRPCPAEVADAAALTTQALRAKGGTPQGVVKHAGATSEQLRIRTLCVTFLCIQVTARAPHAMPQPHVLEAATLWGRGCNPVRWRPQACATLRHLYPCAQYSVYALLRRYATGVLKEGWSSASVLGVGEALKFAISLGMMAAKEEGSESPKVSPRPHAEPNPDPFPDPDPNPDP